MSFFFVIVAFVFSILHVSSCCFLRFFKYLLNWFNWEAGLSVAGETARRYRYTFDIKSTPRYLSVVLASVRSWPQANSTSNRDELWAPRLLVQVVFGQHVFQWRPLHITCVSIRRWRDEKYYRKCCGVVIEIRRGNSLAWERVAHLAAPGTTPPLFFLPPFPPTFFFSCLTRLLHLWRPTIWLVFPPRYYGALTVCYRLLVKLSCSLVALRY